MQLKKLITQLIKQYQPEDLDKVDRILEVFDTAGAPDEVPARVVKAVNTAAKALYAMGVR